MVDVIPISITQIDWPNLLSGLPRDVIRSVDQLSIRLESPSGYIQTLIYYSNLTTNFDSIISHRNICDAFSIGFLIRATPIEIREIMAFNSASLILGDKSESCIWTQNLTDWWLTLQKDSFESPETRIVFNKIFLYFEQAGLRNLWKGFRKKATESHDGTFQLERI